MNSPEIFVRSLDGIWTFDGNNIVSAHAKVDPFAIDFFERWTFARFLPGNALALGFESSQPWSEYGSYGDRYGGIQVLALTEKPSHWSLVAIEYDYRGHDETFVPDDVTWHPRGVLAWLIHDSLQIQVLKKPRGVIASDLLPHRNSYEELEYHYEFMGDWKRLDLSANGNELTATDAAGMEFFDLIGRRRSRDGSTWESWGDYGKVS